MRIKKNLMPELLAPAGDLKKLKYAFAYGADAVYCGLPGYSLRAMTGFTYTDLKKGIIYAHNLKKKVYVTINIIAHNHHLKKLPAHLKKLKNLKPDAVIVADPGVLLMIKKYLPKTDIFLSTQANVLNTEAVKFWKEQGVKRIILGREASLKDIAEINKAVSGIELEIFVHGAMCMSYSGRCYLSTWLAGRSANLGLCAQPCRWKYKVYLEEEQRPGEMMPVEEDKFGSYVLNSKDLNLSLYLSKLVKAGVKSFKIEGRTKSAYYLATVVRVYRLLLDNKISQYEADIELNKIDHRGYTNGFLFGQDKDIQEYATSKLHRGWQFVGECLAYSQNRGSRIIYVKVHNVLKSGDWVEIMTPKDVFRLKIKQLYDKDGNEVNEAHGGTKSVYHFITDNKYDIVDCGIIRKKR